MSNYIATLECTNQTIATLYNASLAITDQLLWLDEVSFQPFVKWATPRLQDAAVSALIWTVISIIKFWLWLLDTIERCAAIDAQAIDMMAWAQAHAPDADVLALAPAAVPVVCPGNRWQRWIARQFSHALLLPSVELAIAADQDKGNAIDPWTGECDWEFSELSLVVPLIAATQPRPWIALLPPVKSTQLPTAPSKGKSKKTPAKPAQKTSGKGKNKSSSSTARTPHKPAQTSRGTRR